MWSRKKHCMLSKCVIEFVTTLPPSAESILERGTWPLYVAKCEPVKAWILNFDAYISYKRLFSCCRPVAPRQEGPRLRSGKVGQRSSPHGQAGPGPNPPGPLIWCSWECLRPTPRRPVWPGHEESPHSARAGAGERERKAQCQWTHVGCGGSVYKMKTADWSGLEDLAMVCVI